MLPEKPMGVSTYDWETGETTYDVPRMDAGQRWRCSISQATEAARRRFPHSNDRIERAYELVHAAKVVLHPKDKTATVTSSDGSRSYHVNGACECPDAVKAPEGWCKHRLSVGILRKALEIMKTFGMAKGPVTIQAEKLATEEEAAPDLPVLEPVTTTVQMPTCPEFQAAVTQPDAPRMVTVHEADVGTIEDDGFDPLAPVVEAEVIPSVPRIPREFLYDNHGTPAILWGGLLHMAHQSGLCALQVDVVTVSETFAVMRATATFNDGGVWTDIGDATPQNVGKKVAASFIRMASTRAKARCLRTALDIDYVAHCELPDSDDLGHD